MESLIQNLGINWKLLAAQMVNFFILLWLLKRFLYGPIIELLARRREAVEKSAGDVENIKEQLAGIETKRQEELDRARKEAGAIVEEARKAAKERGEELMKETEKRVEKIVAEAKRHIEEERVKMTDEVGKEVKDVVFLAVEKVLAERLPKEANERFVAEAVAAARGAKAV
jgi:F-type H+-transporting ATPase subunit b